jgi:hypothetical protein
MALSHSAAVLALINDADLEHDEAVHVFEADKAIIGGNWFVYLSDGQLAGGPVNADGTLDWGTLTTIDMPDAFEYPDLCRKARAMLDAASEPQEAQRGLDPAALEAAQRYAVSFNGAIDRLFTPPAACDLERAINQRAEGRGPGRA